MIARLLSSRGPIVAILLLAVALALPFLSDSTYLRHLMILVFIYGIVAASWDVTLGYTGIFNFAHTAFFGLGVYATGLLAKLGGLDPWASMLLGSVLVAGIAALVAWPVVRLQGIYVVLVTFAFSQLALQFVISQSDLTGGTQGLVRIPTIQLPGYNFLRDYKLGYYYVGLALLGLSVLGLQILVRSDFGLSLRALRDNEDYARARGIPVARQRLKALVASAFVAGLAGGFYAVYLRVASPEVFSFATTSLILSMVLVGGVGTLWGPVLAAVVLTLGSEALANVRGLDEGRHMLVAVAMILALRFLPGGLISALLPRRGAPDRAARPTVQGPTTP
ncbi:branched-chain amino acid ABC transporter permease [Rubellimicrobium arenae]|uniref:branched-chain amino acid ABC transporter permease n=1 Tax=Rubellimicrobium arenae TaxID=2817372 RepID=UPI001B3061F2|nr:branched-chain amino acid ABC transporter permease [Rubellimicrobium arenae]